MEHYERYRIKNSHASRTFLNFIRQEKATITVVHHNDAYGLCSAASLIKRGCKHVFIDALENAFTL
jgi:single-stranded DNA-specific DHH superfamily exonuclease